MKETKITFRLDQDLLRKLDDMRRNEPDLPSRSEMVRRLLARAKIEKKE